LKLAKCTCVYDDKAGTLTCDAIADVVDLTFNIKNGKWVSTVADLFTYDATTKKYTFNFA